MKFLIALKRSLQSDFLRKIQVSGFPSKHYCLPTRKISLTLIDYLFTVPFVAEHWKYYNNRTIKTRVSSEYQIFRQLLSNHIQDLRKAKVEGDTIMLMIKYLKGHGDSVYLILRTLLKFAIIIGFSNGSTENCFSARNRIYSEYRRRLGKEFQGLMTVLHFEKKLNSAVTFAEFLKVWKVIKKKTAP